MRLTCLGINCPHERALQVAIREAAKQPKWEARQPCLPSLSVCPEDALSTVVGLWLGRSVVRGRNLWYI